MTELKLCLTELKRTNKTMTEVKLRQWQNWNLSYDKTETRKQNYDLSETKVMTVVKLWYDSSMTEMKLWYDRTETKL